MANHGDGEGDARLAKCESINHRLPWFMTCLKQQALSIHRPGHPRSLGSAKSFGCAYNRVLQPDIGGVCGVGISTRG